MYDRIDPSDASAADPDALLRSPRAQDGPAQRHLRELERVAAEEAVPRRVPLGWILVGAAVLMLTVAGGMWFAYEQGIRRGVALAPPLIAAESAPIKVRPDDPGGLQVEHQDKLVYRQLEPGADPAGDTAAAQVLGPEEDPLAPPPPEAVAPEDLPIVLEGGQTVAGAPTPVPAQTVVPEPETAAAPPIQAPGAPPVPLDSELGTPGPVAPPAAATVPKAASAAPQESAQAVTLVPPPVAAPTVETTPPPAAVTGDFKVQLGSFRTGEQADRAWQALVDDHADLLNGLAMTPVVVDLGDRGVFHRLQAGPLVDKAAAQTLCEALKARDEGCLVVAP